MAPQSSGVGKAIAFARSLTFGTIGLAVVVFTFEAIAPEDRRPSKIIGAFHGNTDSARLDAERDAQVKTAVALASVQAATQVKWEMERQLNQQQQQILGDSFGGQTGMAGVTDAACIIGGILGAVGGPSVTGAAQALSSACGVGDQIRGNITQTLAQQQRQGSGIMPRSAQTPVQTATNATPPRLVISAPEQPAPVPDVFAARRPPISGGSYAPVRR